jgi:hypothetical protein
MIPKAQISYKVKLVIKVLTLCLYPLLAMAETQSRQTSRLEKKDSGAINCSLALQGQFPSILQTTEQLALFFNTLLTDLPSKQDSSLLSNLIQHGAKDIPLTGYSALKKISARNRARIEAQFPYTPQPGMGYLAKQLERVSFAFIHNTHTMTQAPQFPVLSSRRFAELGFTESLQTGIFNSQFLKSDDNVFFFVVPVIDKHISAVDSIYGSLSMVVDSDYAAQYGWISPFIMAPINFQTFAQNLFPDIFSEIRSSSDRWYVKDKWNAIRPLLQSLQEKLSEYDFTVDDFAAVVRHVLLAQLAKLSEQNLDEYVRIYGAILSDPKSALPIINKYVYEDAFHFRLRTGSMPFEYFEFKIPVAIPEQYVQPVPPE